MNVNFPDLLPSQIQGIKLTSVGKRGRPDIPDLIRSQDSSNFIALVPLAHYCQTNWNRYTGDEQNYISISILDYNLSADLVHWDLYKEVFNCE